LSSKYYDINKLNDVEKKLYNIRKNTHYGISASDLQNSRDITNIINEYINKRLKEGSTMSRNQWILDHDKDYKERWYDLMIKIDNLNLSIEEKFDLAYSIERIIDKAMTLSSSQTEIDRTAWRKR
jgi:hypothetical protein